MHALAGASALEVSQVVIAGTIPLVLVGVGWFVNRATKRLEQTQWANQKLIERRMELHKEMAADLNSIYCAFTFRGHFREVEPDEAIQCKRRADRVYYANDELLSPPLRDAYRTFMRTCFVEGSRQGEDAPLRSDVDVQADERGVGEDWKSRWKGRFQDPSPVEDVDAAYARLKDQFWRDLQLQNRSP